MEYIAYLHKDRKSDFGVSFPDFPGCITAGKTLDESARKGQKMAPSGTVGAIRINSKMRKRARAKAI